MRVNKYEGCHIATARVTNVVEDSIHRLYSLVDKSQPNIIYIDSPLDFAYTMTNINIRPIFNTVMYKTIHDNTARFSVMQYLTSLTSEIDYAIESELFQLYKIRLNIVCDSTNICIPYLVSSIVTVNCNSEIVNLWENLKDIMFYPFEDYCFVIKDIKISQNEKGLHNSTGMSIKFKDGFGIYHLNNIHISNHKKFINNIDSVTNNDFLDIQNTEARREITNLIGYEKFIEITGLEVYDEDEYGKLYVKMAESWREPVIKIIGIINSSQEIDGTYKTYYLRVPPNVMTCLQGLAWCANLTVEEYKSIIKET